MNMILSKIKQFYDENIFIFINFINLYMLYEYQKNIGTYVKVFKYLYNLLFKLTKNLNNNTIYIMPRIYRMRIL
jgi:phosphopentomutase